MTNPFARLEALEQQVQHLSESIGVLSRWCVEMQLALTAHGIHIHVEPPKPHTFQRNPTGEPLLKDTTTTEPVPQPSLMETHET